MQPIFKDNARNIRSIAQSVFAKKNAGKASIALPAFSYIMAPVFVKPLCEKN